MSQTIPSIENLDKVLQLAIRETGAFIRNEFEKFSFSDVQYKSANNPFSYVDLEAEKQLSSTCAALLPGSGFINEESSAISSQNGYTWIIDPLDGTVNFMHGIPHFSISLALMDPTGHIMLGYVWDVMREEMFHAIRGQGAFVNGRRVSVSERNGLGTSVVITGFPYGYASWVDDFLRVMAELVRQCHGVRRLGSAALDLAYVASGRAEAFFEFGINSWDIAAGALLVQEAGGHVSDFMGGSDYLFGRQIIATNSHIHKELLQIIHERIPNHVFSIKNLTV